MTTEATERTDKQIMRMAAIEADAVGAGKSTAHSAIQGLRQAVIGRSPGNYNWQGCSFENMDEREHFIASMHAAFLATIHEEIR